MRAKTQPVCPCASRINHQSSMTDFGGSFFPAAVTGGRAVGCFSLVARFRIDTLAVCEIW